MTLIFSRADALRARAEEQIDAHFARRINALLGPLQVLHALKRQSAMAGHGALADDPAAILARAAEQDAALAALDGDRRQLKQTVRKAASAAEIKSILEKLKVS